MTPVLLRSDATQLLALTQFCTHNTSVSSCCRLSAGPSASPVLSPGMLTLPNTVDSLIAQFAAEVYTNNTQVKSRHYTEGRALRSALFPVLVITECSRSSILGSRHRNTLIGCTSLNYNFMEMLRAATPVAPCQMLRLFCASATADGPVYVPTINASWHLVDNPKNSTCQAS